MAKQSTWKRRFLCAAFLYCFVLYNFAVLIFATLQRRLMYRPTSSASLSVPKLKLDPSELRDVRLQTSDNETLHGWMLNGTNKACIDDHNMRALGIGIDTARYGHHVTFLREDKQPACPAITVMETRTGYQQLRTQIETLHRRFPNAQIYVRIDAAGQYAANIENFLKALTHLQLSISVGEPKRNKDYHSAHSPKRQSDATEGYAMARYAVVEHPKESQGTPPQFAVLSQPHSGTLISATMNRPTSGSIATLCGAFSTRTTSGKNEQLNCATPSLW